MLDKGLVIAATATLVSVSTFVVTALAERRSRVAVSVPRRVRDSAASAAAYFGGRIPTFPHSNAIRSIVIVNPPFASIVSDNVDLSAMYLPSKRSNLDLAVHSNTMAVQNDTRPINVLPPSAPLAMA
jgi:hypothetical protein